SMTRINWHRVLLGGLLAGVVVDAFEFVSNGIVLAHDWDSALQQLGRPMAQGAIPLFEIWGFFVGIAVILLYAVASARFGPGPKTAALSGFIYGIVGYVLPNLGQAPLGLFPVRLLLCYDSRWANRGCGRFNCRRLAL